MFKKITTIFLIVLCFSLTSSLYAFSKGDKCTNVDGKWKGQGSVKLFILSCEYAADVDIGPGNPADVSITVTKTGGSFLCPKRQTYNLTATCDNGNVSIKDDIVDVIGVVADDKNSMKLDGTVLVFYKKHPISLTLDRV